MKPYTLESLPENSQTFTSDLLCPLWLKIIFQKWRQDWVLVVRSFTGEMETEWLLAHSLHKEIESLMFVSSYVKYRASSECHWCPDRAKVPNNLTLLVILSSVLHFRIFKVCIDSDMLFFPSSRLVHLQSCLVLLSSFIMFGVIISFKMKEWQSSYRRICYTYLKIFDHVKCKKTNLLFWSGDYSFCFSWNKTSLKNSIDLYVMFFFL